MVLGNGRGSLTMFGAPEMEAESYALSNYGKGWLGMLHHGPASSFRLLPISVCGQD